MMITIIKITIKNIVRFEFEFVKLLQFSNQILAPGESIVWTTVKAGGMVGGFLREPLWRRHLPCYQWGARVPI